MVVDTTGTQLLQSEALCHLPVHRAEHTHTLKDLSAWMGDIYRIVDSERKQSSKKHAFCEGTWKQYNET